MSSIKEHLFDVEQARAERWIREHLGDESADENSPGWRELEIEYSNLQEYLADQATFEAELQWLQDNSTSLIHEIFTVNVEELKGFVDSSFADESKVMVNKMAYAYAVTLLESFLGDTLKSLVSENESFFKNAISNVDELRKARYSLEDLASGEVSAKGLAIKKLSDILYHNIPKTIKAYEAALGISINIDLTRIVEIVGIRHDIAHRNGITKDGESIEISDLDMEQLFIVITTFAEQLHQEITAASALSKR